MAKKSRAQKIQESAADNDVGSKKHLSKYALKKLAQQNELRHGSSHNQDYDEHNGASTSSSSAGSKVVTRRVFRGDKTYETTISSDSHSGSLVEHSDQQGNATQGEAQGSNRGAKSQRTSGSSSKRSQSKGGAKGTRLDSSRPKRGKNASASEAQTQSQEPNAQEGEQSASTNNASEQRRGRNGQRKQRNEHAAKGSGRSRDAQQATRITSEQDQEIAVSAANQDTADSSQASSADASPSQGSSRRLSLKGKRAHVGQEQLIAHDEGSGDQSAELAEERRKAAAKAKAMRAAMEGAAGIERSEDYDSSRNRKNILTRRGKVITVERKGGLGRVYRNPNDQVETIDPALDPLKIAKMQEHRAKSQAHAQAVKEARAQALQQLRSQGKKLIKHNSSSAEELPQKAYFDRQEVETCGVVIRDRVPDLTDLAEREASMQPHNRRDQLLFAPIKRINQPITGTDFMVKFLDNWSRRNDSQGIFKDFFEQVINVRKNENGIAYIGLPAFLKFLEGINKRSITDQYALDFRLFIKRREVTDFIRSMSPPALDWMKNRHQLEPYYAFVYFDTYPIHVKLGKKRIICEQVLFIVGVTLDGRKDILGIVPDLTSNLVSVDFWDQILKHLKDLGCCEICYVVAAFKCRYLERSLKTYFPNATMHFNLLELLQFDSFSLPDDKRAEFMEDAHLLCEQPSYEQAYGVLNQLRDKWEGLMKDGETILQGSLDYLKVHTLLNNEDRKIFTSQKMVAQAATLLLGNKSSDDFFSDNIEMLTYLFYRYLLVAKHYWFEHQDYAINNLSFAKLFSQLRHLDLPGSRLLHELLSEQHQDFMYRHFGHFGNGPVFNLNPNKKRISLSGQIDDNTMIRGDQWHDNSNAQLNTAPEVTDLNAGSSANATPSIEPTLLQDGTAAGATASLGSSAQAAASLGAGVAKSHGKIPVLKGAPNTLDQSGKLSYGIATKDEGPALTLKPESNSLKQFAPRHNHDGSGALLSLNEHDTVFEKSPTLSDLGLGSRGGNVFSSENLFSFESNAFKALGVLGLEESVPAFLREGQEQATLTLNIASLFTLPGELGTLASFNFGSSASGSTGTTTAHDTASIAAADADTDVGPDAGADASAHAQSSPTTQAKLKSKPSKLAVAIRLDYQKFSHGRILFNGQEFLPSHAALGQLEQDKILNQVLDSNSDIEGIDQVDGTYGFKLMRSRRSHAKSVRNQEHDHAATNATEATASADPANVGAVANDAAVAASCASQGTTLGTSDDQSNLSLNVATDGSLHLQEPQPSVADNTSTGQMVNAQTSGQGPALSDGQVQGQDVAQEEPNKDFNASYLRRFKDDPVTNYQMEERLGALKNEYVIDSVAGLEGIDKLNVAKDLNPDLNQAAQPDKKANYFDGVSSNIQRANAVIGMLRPSIALALRQDRVLLKKQERHLIYQCLGSDFDLDNLNNVIHQVTPIFRTTMQTKINEVAERNKQKKAEAKARKKAKARELYLKRQELKAQAAQEQGQAASIAGSSTALRANQGLVAPVEPAELNDPNFEPLDASDFTALNSIDELSSLNDEHNNSFIAQTITLKSSGQVQSGVVINNVMLSAQNQGTIELNEATKLTGILAPNDGDDEQLTLIKPAEAQVQVVPAQYRSAIAEQMTKNKVSGVATPKLDTTLKLKS